MTTSAIVALALVPCLMSPPVRWPAIMAPHVQPADQTPATNPPLNATQRNQVVEAVAKILVAHYTVDPKKARSASDALIAAEKRGDYDSVGDGTALAERLNHDIQGWTHDDKLTVHYSSDAIPSTPPVPTAAQREEYRATLLRQNCTVERVEVLPGNIGYIKFNFFPDATICGPILQASLQRLDQSDAIVFDLRDNVGGFPEMVASVAAQLFDRPVLWYNPRANPNAGMLSPASRSTLADKPVYILTSSRTFSGAEHFAYDLQMLKRATVVGEATRGGHPGVPCHIDEHFWMAVPEIRKLSPYGTFDWEGTGVEPDIKVSAADALTRAEELATRAHKQ